MTLYELKIIGIAIFQAFLLVATSILYFLGFIFILKVPENPLLLPKAVIFISVAFLSYWCYIKLDDNCRLQIFNNAIKSVAKKKEDELLKDAKDVDL